MGSFIAIIKSIISKLKLGYLIVLLFISTLLLDFLPDYFLKRIDLLSFRNQFHSQISICLLISGVLLLIIVLDKFWNFIKRVINNPTRLFKIFLYKYISLDENSILVRTFYDKNNNQFLTTGYAEISDGIINGLQARGIIYRASTVGAIGFSFAYNLQPYALQYLNKLLYKKKIRIENGFIVFK